MYNIKIVQHFTCPKNAGAIRGADAVGKAVGLDKGDIVKFYFKINSQTHIIEDAHFKTMGCPAAIACSDIACEMVKGKTIEEAEKLSNADIINSLGDLPKDKISCVKTVEEAMRKTIQEFLKKQSLTF